MGLPMEKLLKKFNECNKFSLSDKCTQCRITEEEFEKALKESEEHIKRERRKYYNEEDFLNYPSFDEMFEGIKKECLEYDKLKQKNKFCSICDNVGKTTKYGSEHTNFFWHFYHNIGMNIEREKDKEQYCLKNEIDIIEQIPKELKPYFLYYEVSFLNNVTFCSALFVNYYFELNEETKKYLMKFENDFEYMDNLEDLAFYKDDEVKFFSCTHERYNSLEFDYKKMNKNEIDEFIKDEFYNENKKIKERKKYLKEINDKKLIKHCQDLCQDEFTESDIMLATNTINILVDMSEQTIFSFKDFAINKKVLMEIICTICDKLNIEIVSHKNLTHNWKIVNKNGNFEELEDLPAYFCNIEDSIIKKR